MRRNIAIVVKGLFIVQQYFVVTWLISGRIEKRHDMSKVLKRRNTIASTDLMQARLLLWRIGASLLFALMLMAAFQLPVTAEDSNAMPEEGKLSIDMDPFNFPLFDRGRTTGRVSLMLTLVVQDQRDSERVRLHMPQIRSDFLSALTSLSRQRFKVNKPIDPDIVRAYLSPFLNYRLGEGKVDVFVKQALINPA